MGELTIAITLLKILARIHKIGWIEARLSRGRRGRRRGKRMRIRKRKRNILNAGEYVHFLISCSFLFGGFAVFISALPAATTIFLEITRCSTVVPFISAYVYINWLFCCGLFNASIINIFEC